MTVLKMGDKSFIHVYVIRQRKTHTREELKKQYSYCCRNGFYPIAQVYLYALYGRKACFYDYQRSKVGLYAYEYPPIKA